MKSKTIVDILISLFILLFIYTATSKVLNWDDTVKSMHNQPINRSLADVLVYALPILELGVIGLMLFNRTKLLGIYIFTGMMLAFTGYVALVLTNYYGRVPCSCGGIIKEMGWRSHLTMNITFVILGLVAIYLIKKKEPKYFVPNKNMIVAE
ncbi:hypothetical protein GFS24_28140 [Chitinophaga sp. SYP-B3965]|uniref:MauE/DoxX family redox-associated membrane protein n=1 Tax=Chitinophaga sp. SYP-B3965 TaxID=2663120 RepID=UPI0012999830|nr:MauE/DoxX family redox-associated membrane protein [Chitinophaga sp. SYP-B3965]MRG49012.1 hypothetical protein [Chitinophaga sp. SYP-B3965]